MRVPVHVLMRHRLIGVVGPHLLEEVCGFHVDTHGSEDDCELALLCGRLLHITL